MSEHRADIWSTSIGLDGHPGMSDVLNQYHANIGYILLWMCISVFVVHVCVYFAGRARARKREQRDPTYSAL
jgi:heme/copper-type cytochrome/quinol oxidase subunit 2